MSTPSATATNTASTGTGPLGIALVTGASTGIGAVYAERLAKRGYDLILVARNEARLREVAQRIRAATGRQVFAQIADLNNARDRAEIEETLRSNPGITLLVNNAGVAASAPLGAADADAMEQMIDLNVTALTRLTLAAIPGFTARGKGTIINIASVLGITPEILNGVYGASKAYVIAFTQALANELKEKNLRVQAVLPGATATPLWDLIGVPHNTLPTEWVMPVEDMVDAALVGLDAGEVITIPPLHDKALWESYEGARQVMRDKLSTSAPAPRYLRAS